MTDEVNERNEALATVVRDMVRPISVGFGLFIGYQVFAGYPRYSGLDRWLVVGADAFVALFLLALGIVFWTRRSLPLPWANAGGAAIAIALVGTDMVTMSVKGAVPSFPAGAMALAGLGVVVLSWRWLLVTELSLFAVWLVVTEAFTSNPRAAIFVIQIAVLAAIAIHWGRLSAYTQLIDAKQRARAANDQLAAINAELDRFAAVVAHDLKNPISALRLKSGLLGAKHEDPEIRAVAGDMDRIATDMGQLVDDLLAYARGAHEVDEKDGRLQDVAQEVGELFADAVEEAGGQLVVAELPEYRAPHSMLRQLLQNLVSNALLYRGPDAPRIVIAGRKAPGGVEFWVDDNGLGFPPEFANKMFAPFQRGDVTEPGYGLGLATCQRIAEALGGTIAASSSGKGATFTVKLPTVQSKEEGEKEVGVITR